MWKSQSDAEKGTDAWEWQLRLDWAGETPPRTSDGYQGMDIVSYMATEPDQQWERECLVYRTSDGFQGLYIVSSEPGGMSGRGAGASVQLMHAGR